MPIRITPAVTETVTAAKAIAAGVSTGATVVLAAVTSLPDTWLPQHAQITAWIAVAISALGTAAVWLKKNEPIIEADAGKVDAWLASLSKPAAPVVSPLADLAPSLVADTPESIIADSTVPDDFADLATGKHEASASA